MATDAPQHVFGDEAVEQALNEAKAVALEAYTSNTRGVLFAPNAKRVSGAVAKAVTDKVIDVLEARVAETLGSLEQAPKLDPEPVETDRVADAEHEGYVAGLKRAWLIVENLEGKPGKLMIRDILHTELLKAEGIVEV